MIDPQRTDESVENLNEAKKLQSSEPVATIETPTDSNAGAADAIEAASQTLSAEEQMALYEKALKEDDWGHQPC